jgi:hypothetical protein
MTEETLPVSPRPSGWPGAAASGSPETAPAPAPAPGHRSVADLPHRVGEWSLTQVAAGMWLSPARAAPSDVAALRAEPGRASVIIDADGPDARTDDLLRALFPLLSTAGMVTLRLVLSAGAGRYAVAASRAFGLDLIAAPDNVTITPYGYAVVRSADPVAAGPPPQWRRCLPAGSDDAAGILAPSPDWERPLAAGLAVDLGRRLAVRRVPAGIALEPPDPEAALAAAANSVWPDPERLTVVLAGAGPREMEMLRDGLGALLPRLPLPATDGVRLYWPRAGAGADGPELQELAARCGTDLIAPAADVSASGGFGGVCHGPGGAAPWLRFSRDGNVQVLGSLYPVPAWEWALGEADLGELAGRLVIEHVAAGVCVYRPGSSARGLIATARSVIPDPARATIVLGDDARSEDARQDLEAVLSRLPRPAVTSLRILLSGAGSGAQDSYAQFLADTLNSQIVAPTGRWTATPDGRLRVLAEPRQATSAQPPGDGWQACRPRATAPARRSPSGPPGGQPPERRAPERQPAALPSAQVSGSAGPSATAPAPASAERRPRTPAAPAAPEPSKPPGQPAPPASAEPAGPVPPPPSEPAVPPRQVAGGIGTPNRVALLSRHHRSSAQERSLYRETAASYPTFSVSVRRMLTQRPGLRVAAVGDEQDAVVTDFAAVLDLLSADQQAVAAALRLTGMASDPRVACALSGLRRLPSFTGVVFSSASSPGSVPPAYAAGQFLIEPAFVRATSSCLVGLEGGIEYVIWSETGKRIAALAADADRDEIIFAGGTAYRVLQASALPGTAQIRVFLRESSTFHRAGPGGPPAPPGRPDGQLDEMDGKVLERLVLEAARHDDAAARGQVMARPGTGGRLPIGVDPGAMPFQPDHP